MSGGDILLLAAVLMGGPAAWIKYKSYLNHLKDREAALAEASHGAAMIVLPVVAYVGMGVRVPPWFFLAALAVMFWGGLRLFNGAKFSVGWRDPQLITRALVKICVGGAIYTWGPRGLLVAAIVWWCLLTGITKLVLVLRGFPAAPWDTQNPAMPHGKAGFSGPDDPGWKL